MNHTISLPEPSSDALQHSQKLVVRIREEIKSHQGAITFRRYMEMALYEPALGYYVAGTHKIGAEGDFVTAPEISPLFSQCIAEQCVEVLKEINRDTSTPLRASILEFGAGSGAMATEVLRELEAQNTLPEHYYILDVSPDLKQRQKESFEKHIPHLLPKIIWLSELPKDFSGVILGNEVLDAMPVDVFTQQNDTVFEHHVIWEEGELREQLRPASDTLSKQVLALKLPHEATPYTSEINPNLEAWFNSVSNCMKQGVILLVDYGYPQKEYYLADRNKGTLICHYQHLVNEAPLLYSGLQDITANVDFTAVAESADKADFQVAGFVSQVSFLSNAGLEKFFMQALDKNPDDQYKLAQQVRTISLPSEMGERFKFIGLSKDYDKPLLGFSAMDQLHRL
ncbi:MAG: SAM-dependent methyltransferase [Cocleimonas sp.]